MHEAVVIVQHSKPTRERKVVVLRKSNHGALVLFRCSHYGMLGIKKQPATCGRRSGVRCHVMGPVRSFWDVLEREENRSHSHYVLVQSRNHVTLRTRAAAGGNGYW
jgi:hypothetical protein